MGRDADGEVKKKGGVDMALDTDEDGMLKWVYEKRKQGEKKGFARPKRRGYTKDVFNLDRQWLSWTV